MILLVCSKGEVIGGMWWYGLCVLRVSRWKNMKILLVCSEGEQIGECHNTDCLYLG